MAVKKPYKLTEAKIKPIVQGIRMGLAWDAIAGTVGVCPRTLRNWLKPQKDPDRLVRKLQREVAQAEAALIKERLGRINRAAQGGAEYKEFRITKPIDGPPTEETAIIRQTPPDWKADAWFLERRFPKYFSERHHEIEDDSDDFTEDNPLIIGMTPDGETQDLFAEYRDHPFSQDAG